MTPIIFWLRGLWVWLFAHEQPYICAASYNPCIRSPNTHWLVDWWAFNRRPRIRYNPYALVMRGDRWLTRERARHHVGARRLLTGRVQDPWQDTVTR